MVLACSNVNNKWVAPSLVWANNTALDHNTALAHNTELANSMVTVNNSWDLNMIWGHNTAAMGWIKELTPTMDKDNQGMVCSHNTPKEAATITLQGTTLMLTNSVVKWLEANTVHHPISLAQDLTLQTSIQLVGKEPDNLWHRIVMTLTLEVLSQVPSPRSQASVTMIMVDHQSSTERTMSPQVVMMKMMKSLSLSPRLRSCLIANN